MRDPFCTRLEKAVAERGVLCVGIDPSREQLATWGLDDGPAGVERLARTAVAAVADVVAVVKPQVAFFERHGAAGVAVLERTIADARAAGLLVIADAKRGDIESTNVGYAQAWLDDDSPLAADAVTLTCYLGAAALRPCFALASATGRGVFAVVASSNPEGRTLQEATLGDGRSVEAGLLGELRALDEELGATRALGAVIGATRRPAGLAEFPNPVLCVGVGAQGAAAADVAALREVLTHGALCVNVARHVLDAGPDVRGLADAAARFQEALR